MGVGRRKEGECEEEKMGVDEEEGGRKGSVKRRRWG